MRYRLVVFYIDGIAYGMSIARYSMPSVYLSYSPKHGMQPMLSRLKMNIIIHAPSPKSALRQKGRLP